MTGYESKKKAASAKTIDQVNWIDHEPDGGRIAQEPMAMLFGSLPVYDTAPPQPAQEPVAWMYDWFCDGKMITGWIAHSESEIPKLMASNIRPLYTALPQCTVQVSPLEFVEMVMDKEHLVGNPIVWAQWPNKEKNNGT